MMALCVVANGWSMDEEGQTIVETWTVSPFSSGSSNTMSLKVSKEDSTRSDVSKTGTKRGNRQTNTNSEGVSKKSRTGDAFLNANNSSIPVKPGEQKSPSEASDYGIGTSASKQNTECLSNTIEPAEDVEATQFKSELSRCFNEIKDFPADDKVFFIAMKLEAACNLCAPKTQIKEILDTILKELNKVADSDNNVLIDAFKNYIDIFPTLLKCMKLLGDEQPKNFQTSYKALCDSIYCSYTTVNTNNKTESPAVEHSVDVQNGNSQAVSYLNYLVKTLSED